MLSAIKTVKTKEIDTLSSCWAKVSFYAKPQPFCLYFQGVWGRWVGATPTTSHHLLLAPTYLPE